MCNNNDDILEKHISNTLERAKEDWVEIPRLRFWDDTTCAWCETLKPIIRRLIAAFDEEVDQDFWDHVVSHSTVECGTNIISDRISAFYSTDKGKFICDTSITPT